MSEVSSLSADTDLLLRSLEPWQRAKDQMPQGFICMGVLLNWGMFLVRNEMEMLN